MKLGSVARRAALAAVVSAFATGGCSSCVRGLPRGGLIRDASRITTVLGQRATRVRALRAHGSADIYNREGRKRGDLDIAVRAPDRIRFDISAFGVSFFSLVSDGTRFGLLQGNQFVVGPARACAAQRIAGIALEAREIAAVLSGGVPVIGTPVGPVRWEEGRYVVDLRTTEGNTARIELELPPDQDALPPDRQTPRVSRMVLRDLRGPRADIRYESYRVVQGEAYPDRVRVLIQRDEVDMQIRFDRIEPGDPVPVAPDVTDPLADENGPPQTNDPFRVAPPLPTTEVIPIDC